MLTYGNIQWELSLKSLTNADNYFEGIGNMPKEIKDLAIFGEHNNEYLTICYYNLKEKHLRGQKDFTKEKYDDILYEHSARVTKNIEN